MLGLIGNALGLGIKIMVKRFILMQRKTQKVLS